jgi:CRISPR-associated protein Cmr1
MEEKMKKVSVTLETITPLFLSGNDQTTVELRAASIRGQLRYWYRILLGGTLTGYYPQPERLGDEIHKREAEIFGTTDRGSRVLVRVRGLPSHRETGFSFSGKFIRYLGYGLENRKAFPPGQKFDLEISLWKSANEFESVIAATSWATLCLGNLGARSRRGFGSLTLTNEVSWGTLTMKQPASLEELTDQLRANLKSVVSVFEEHTGHKYAAPSGLPPFSVVCPQYWKLLVVKTPYGSWEKALDAIGETLRGFREDRTRQQHSRTTSSGKTFSYYVTKDYDAVKGFFDKRGPTTPQGSIFGLPHQFQFGSTGDKVMIKGRGDIDRRASPLYIRIFKAGSKYYLGLQVFKSRFLPDDLEFQDLNDESHTGVAEAPTYKALDDFIASLKDTEEISPWEG